MFIYDLLFYMFATLLIGSSLGVIIAKNPVYAVLYLIFAFFNAAGLFILLGAEFLAMTLIIVYVGAVAVLFLFVVMMLNIKLAEIKKLVIKRRILLIMVGVLLLVNLCLVIHASMTENKMVLLPTFASHAFSDLTNTEAIGMVLYTNFALLFEMSGIILLVAMIGAIVLTYRGRDMLTKRQDISKQLSRTKATGMKIVSVRTGEGVDASSYE